MAHSALDHRIIPAPKHPTGSEAPPDAANGYDMENTINPLPVIKWYRLANTYASGKKCIPMMNIAAGRTHRDKPIFARILPTTRITIHYVTFTILKTRSAFFFAGDGGSATSAA
jgi:hypothetical protein